MTMRSLAIVASAVVAVGVVGLAYLLGAHSTAPRPGNASAIGMPRSAAPPAGPADPPAWGDPVAVATAWLRAYRGIAWTDRSPSSWADRVRPYARRDLAPEHAQAPPRNPGTTRASFLH